MRGARQGREHGHHPLPAAAGARGSVRQLSLLWPGGPALDGVGTGVLGESCRAAAAYPLTMATTVGGMPVPVRAGSRARLLLLAFLVTMSFGASGTGVNCFNGRRGVMLSWSGSGAFWPFEVAASAKSRNVPAGTRLAIHVPADKLVYFCRAYLSAMRCTHSVTHRGFMIGLVVARLV